MLFEVHEALLAESDALLFEQADLHVLPAERERRRDPALAVDDAEARDMRRVGIDVQRITDHARKARVPGEGCDLPVGRDPAARDPPHDIIDCVEGVCQGFQRSFLLPGAAFRRSALRYYTTNVGSARSFTRVSPEKGGFISRLYKKTIASSPGL